MSKLRDLVRQAGRSRSEAIGFARMTSGSRSLPIVIVAVVNDDVTARSAIEAQASALLYVGPLDGVESVVEVAGSRPVGCRLEHARGGEAAELAELGVDFLVFDDGRAEAAALRPPELGRVVLLTGDENEERLRTLAALEPDAGLVAQPSDVTDGGRVSARALAALRRRAELLNAPLAIEASAVDADTLEAWRDAAAPILVVATDLVAEAVAAASHVAPPRGRLRDRPSALLTFATARTEEVHEHDDD